MEDISCLFPWSVCQPTVINLINFICGSLLFRWAVFHSCFLKSRFSGFTGKNKKCVEMFPLQIVFIILFLLFLLYYYSANGS